ncbi:tetratricopeptide repeat protein [bacterium]|nr:tetratricopeptide repeat protein [bacterium]
MAAPAPSNRDLLKAATDAFNAQAYPDAIAALGKVTAEDSGIQAQALALLGRSKSRTGAYAEAVAALEQAMTLRPSPLNQYYLGEARFQQGDHEAALDELKAAVALDPTLTDAFILIGTIHRSKGRYDEATKALNLALRNDPKAVAARFQLAQAAYDAGDLQRATSQAFLIIQQQEDFAPVHLLLGHCALRLNDFRQAAYEYCRVLQLQEPTLEVYEGLGRSFANLKDFPQAIKAFEAVIAMAPDNEMAYVAAARLCDRQGEKEKAIKLWQRTLHFPKYAQLASDALAKLGAESAGTGAAPAAAPKKKGKAGAKPAAPAAIDLTNLPRDFEPPRQLDRSTLPQRAPAHMPTAPLTNHAAGTLSLASRQPQKTQPFTAPLTTPHAAPLPVRTEPQTVKEKFTSALDQMLRPSLEAMASLMAKARKQPDNSPPVDGGSHESIASMMAKRAAEQASAQAPAPAKQKAPGNPAPKKTKPR